MKCMFYPQLCITRALLLQEVMICTAFAAPTVTLPISLLKQGVALAALLAGGSRSHRGLPCRYVDSVITE